MGLLQYAFWDYQRFAVQALLDLDRPEDALAYAESRTSPNDRQQVVAACERILRDLGREDEAYARYAMEAHRASTYLGTFRSLGKAYPSFAPAKLLADLVAANPGNEGKWFATAVPISEVPVQVDGKGFPSASATARCSRPRRRSRPSSSTGSPRAGRADRLR